MSKPDCSELAEPKCCTDLSHIFESRHLPVCSAPIRPWVMGFSTVMWLPSYILTCIASPVEACFRAKRICLLRGGWMRRVGDPAKELSIEYSITLKTSLAPSNTYTYPLV